ncbi:MAG: RHS repeat-associated core domain-containing protein [Verrucomicrobia bacterium]|nr:RHS repeat-associated core domain-containing protein [Verrucomicrobiota bacterium]
MRTCINRGALQRAQAPGLHVLARICLIWAVIATESVKAVAPAGTGRVGWQPSGAPGCSSCGGGSGDFTVGVDFEVSLGARAEGAAAGSLYLTRGVPDLHMFQTTELSTSYDPPIGTDVEVIRSGARNHEAIIQVVTPNVFVATTTGQQGGLYSYEIRFYDVLAKGSPIQVAAHFDDQTGESVPAYHYYAINDPDGSKLIATWLIEDPTYDGTDKNSLRIRETRGAQVREWMYTHSGDEVSRKWVLTLPGGLGRHEYTVDSSNDTVVQNGVSIQVTHRRISILRVFNNLNELVHQEEKIEDLYGWGWGTTQESVGSGTERRATNYSFGTPPGDVTSNVMPLSQATRPDGTWSRYFYGGTASTFHLITREEDGWADTASDNYASSNLREVDYSYGSEDSQADLLTVAPTRPRRVREIVMGQAVSQTVHVYVGAAAPNSDLIMEHREYRLPTDGAALTDPAALTTVTYYSTSTPGGTASDAGEVDRVKFPDGTWAIHTYLRDLQAHTRAYTVRIGEAQINGNAVTLLNGNETVVLRGSQGEALSRTERYISGGATSYLVSQVTYSLIDSSQRPGRATYLNGRYFSFVYDCCGLSSVTDFDGVQTVYGYDLLKRLTSVSRLGVTTLYGLDLLGRRLVETRVGSQGGVIVTEQRQYDTAGFLSRQTNAINGVTTFARNTTAYGETITTTYPDLSTRIEDHDLAGLLIQVSGTAAHRLKYEYGVGASPFAGQMFTKEIRQKLDPAVPSNPPVVDTEWVKTYTDFQGRTSARVFADKTPGSETDNPLESFSYNLKGQLAKKVDADGVTKVFAYNGRGQLKYDALVMKPVDAVLDPGTGNYAISWSVDRIARTEQFVDNSTSPWTAGTVAIKSQAYLSYPLDYIYGSDGTLVSETWTSADGLRQRSIAFGQATDTVTTYGANGTRTRVQTLPDLSTATESFVNGRLMTFTRNSSAGVTLSQVNYVYDQHGRVSSSVDLRSGTATFGYNTADQLTSVLSPAPGTGEGPQLTQTDYDNRFRPWRVTLPDGGQITNIYYLDGLLQKTFGTRTYPVEYTYDFQGRMLTMKTWQDSSSTTTPKNAITTWTYSSDRGFLETKRYADPTTGNPGGNGTDYTYSKGGRIKTRTWTRANGQGARLKTTYVYGFDDGPAQNDPRDNEHGELVGIQYNDGGLTPDVGFGLDRLGRRATVTRAGMTTSLGYSLAWHLDGETYAGGSLSGLTVAMTSDSLLRPGTLDVHNGAQLIGSAVTYGYDAASRIASVTDGAFNTGYVYENSANLVRTVTLKQNTTPRVTSEQRYDLLGRLRSVSSSLNGSGGPPAVASGYQYNSANQRERDREADGSYWNYTYDKLGQVTSGKKFWSDGTPVAGMQFEYTFDDIGNRKTAKSGGDQTGANLRIGTYTSDRLNQINQRTVSGSFDVIGAVASSAQTVTVNGATPYRKDGFFRQSVSAPNSTTPQWTAVTVSGAGSTASGNVWTPKTPEVYSTDADGNLLSDGRWSYLWDSENRLVRMTALTAVGPQQRIDFEYDWQGRRIGKKVWSNTAGTGSPILTRVYVYRGWNLVMELDGATQAMVMQYVWGRDLAGGVDGGGAGGVGGLVEVKTATATYGVVYDGNGNVMGLVDATSGTVATRYEYGPFGELIRGSGPMARSNPFRFSTKYQDDETEFIYYGYRYYNASTGRWPNRDPIGERGGNNLYCFVRNGPQGAVDTTGLAVYTIPMYWGMGMPYYQGDTIWEHLPYIPPNIAGAALNSAAALVQGASGFFDWVFREGAAESTLGLIHLPIPRFPPALARS